jgi:hypothetical protein
MMIPITGFDAGFWAGICGACFGWLELSGKPGLPWEAADYRVLPDGRKRFPLLCVCAIWCHFPDVGE